MSFNFPDRVLGQVFADFGNDPFLDIGVEGVPQIGERARRRDDDQRCDAALAHHFLQSRRHPLDEAVLFQSMPVGLFNTAAAVRSRVRKTDYGPVGSLLVGRRVLLGEDALGLQVGEFLIAGIAQEESFAAVTDEDEGVMRYCELVHIQLPSESNAPRMAAAMSLTLQRQGCEVQRAAILRGARGPPYGLLRGRRFGLRLGFLS